MGGRNDPNIVYTYEKTKKKDKIFVKLKHPVLIKFSVDKR
jgi:hypothetical protein